MRFGMGSEPYGAAARDGVPTLQDGVSSGPCTHWRCACCVVLTCSLHVRLSRAWAIWRDAVSRLLVLGELPLPAARWPERGRDSRDLGWHLMLER